MTKFIFIFLISISVFGQNAKEERQRKLEEKKELSKQKSERAKLGIINCEDLQVEKQELQGITTLGFKNNSFNLPNLTVSRTEKNEIFEYNINFYHMSGFCNDDMQGIFFKLENGEILRYPDIRLKCNLVPHYGYILQGSVLIDEELHAKLLLSKIVQYGLAKSEHDVEYKNSGDFKTLIECLYNH
ncbi:hypothetical protein FLGE108171_15620 [Flavobacterium gelidilacus]|uniref:hypothetical protein n=1 Tax=Flavobacterium gelidilacus TaxID=206041 RepID=UPI00041F8C06|nr:hypothetical protein [Flavobacterium gelidilacus]